MPAIPTWVELSEIVRNFAIVVGGAVGIGIAWWRGLAASRQATAARDQAALARRDHATELYSKSVEQLGHERLEVRLGAIYTLGRIGREFPDLSFPTLELLQAFVRERSVEADAGAMKPDVAEAIRIVSRMANEVSGNAGKTEIHI